MVDHQLGVKEKWCTERYLLFKDNYFKDNLIRPLSLSQLVAVKLCNCEVFKQCLLNNPGH